MSVKHQRWYVSKSTVQSFITSSMFANLVARGMYQRIKITENSAVKFIREIWTQGYSVAMTKIDTNKRRLVKKKNGTRITNHLDVRCSCSWIHKLPPGGMALPSTLKDRLWGQAVWMVIFQSVSLLSSVVVTPVGTGCGRLSSRQMSDLVPCSSALYFFANCFVRVYRSRWKQARMQKNRMPIMNASVKTDMMLEMNTLMNLEDQSTV